MQLGRSQGLGWTWEYHRAVRPMSRWSQALNHDPSWHWRANGYVAWSRAGLWILICAPLRSKMQYRNPKKTFIKIFWPCPSLTTRIWAFPGPPKPGPLLARSQRGRLGRKPPQIGHFEKPVFESAGAESMGTANTRREKSLLMNRMTYARKQIYRNGKVNRTF